MMTEKTKDAILKSITWESRRPYGGQHVGVDPGVILTHDLFGIKIEMYEYRSMIDNRGVAISMFRHFLDGLPRNIIDALNREYDPRPNPPTGDLPGEGGDMHAN